MIGCHQTTAERAHSEAAWAALFAGALADNIEDGLDQPDPPLTGRALFEAERQERIDSDLSWSGDSEPEGW